MNPPRASLLCSLALAACGAAQSSTTTPAGTTTATTATAPAAAAHGAPAPGESGSPAERFDAFAQRYFVERYRFAPSEGTANGVHDHDDALDDLSPAAIERYTQWLASQRDALDAMIPQLPEDRPGVAAPASDHPRLDAQLLRNTIALEYTRLHDWREWQTRPGTYHALAADSIYQLILREFAPAPARVRAATARLRAIPALLRTGEANLTNPSRLAVEVALREIDGSIAMVRDTFPAFARRGADAADLPAALAAATEAATALEHHRDFLHNTLLPRATGDYHDGRERWVLRASLSDGVTETPEQIRDASLAEVHRLQGELRELARRVARPHEDFASVLSRQRHTHPAAAALIDTYRGRQDTVRTYVRDHSLATIDPARDDLAVVETPEFLRATIFAALSSPGPFERVARRTFFYVTPADTTRSAHEIDEYLTEHSNAAIDVTSIHEAYPGHHVQGIHQRRAPSLVRQVLWQGTYGEGWAHYTEQMMVDQGFGDDVIRLDQRQEALLRAARAYLDVGVHVFGMSYDDAVRFYRDEAFLSQPGAEMEARRVCLEPSTVFIYTYGKFAIYRLRHQVLRDGNLGAFHDALMDFGSAPLPALARALYHVELGPWRPGETFDVVPAAAAHATATR